VKFVYPSRNDNIVLNDISFSIEPGTVLSLVGSSGSGKSTVVSLIKRFYDPIEGDILIDGVNIKELDAHWLRKNIGVVDQEPILFSGTIRENITYSKPTSTEEEINKIIKQAHCEFILEFPKGLDTIIGERGVQLSGGQKQRIAIARALLKDPKILILDEATSALDSTTEQLVQEALQQLMKNRTVVIIAHRLSTSKRSNIILVLKDGKIIEKGDHEKLMNQNGEYYQFAVKQGVK